MRNFKIGDRIKVVKLLTDCKCARIGDIGIIDGIREDSNFPIRVTINNNLNYGFKEDEIEKIENLEQNIINNKWDELKVYIISEKDRIENSDDIPQSIYENILSKMKNLEENNN